jgi:hypothetical protein
LLARRGGAAHGAMLPAPNLPGVFMTAMTVRRRCLTMTASVALVCTAGAVGLVAAAPAAFAAPSVAVVSSSSSVAANGRLYIVGEVKNTSAGDVSGVDVTIGLYNASNALIGTDDASTLMHGLSAGEKGGFLDIVDPVAGYASYKILSATAVAASVAPYHQFSVSNLSDVADSSGVHEITGNVTNAGFFAAQSVTAFYTFYNAAGTVVDVDNQPVGSDRRNSRAGRRRRRCARV